MSGHKKYGACRNFTETNSSAIEPLFFKLADTSVSRVVGLNTSDKFAVGVFDRTKKKYTMYLLNPSDNSVEIEFETSLVSFFESDSTKICNMDNAWNDTIAVTCFYENSGDIVYFAYNINSHEFVVDPKLLTDDSNAERSLRFFYSLDGSVIKSYLVRPTSEASSIMVDVYSH